RHTSPTNNLPVFLRCKVILLSTSAPQHLSTQTRTEIHCILSRMWSKSSRHHHLEDRDPKMLSGSFMKLALALTHRHHFSNLAMHKTHTP
ncbi:hypothetical protein PAXRUDRAFT_158521, partial [Paxillus rubicundulus Ve08.2h10]